MSRFLLEIAYWMAAMAFAVASGGLAHYSAWGAAVFTGLFSLGLFMESAAASHVRQMEARK